MHHAVNLRRQVRLDLLRRPLPTAEIVRLPHRGESDAPVAAVPAGEGSETRAAVPGPER